MIENVGIPGLGLGRGMNLAMWDETPIIQARMLPASILFLQTSTKSAKQLLNSVYAEAGLLCGPYRPGALSWTALRMTWASSSVLQPLQSPEVQTTETKNAP